MTYDKSVALAKLDPYKELLPPRVIDTEEIEKQILAKLTLVERLVLGI